MADDNEIMGQMMFEKAKTEYPYLADKEISFAYTPTEGDRMLEFYNVDETERPAYLPAGKVGIEVFSPKAKPIDILGDYVSHYAVEKDPKLSQMYEGFKSATPEQVMRERYAYHQQNFKEDRPYEDWARMTGYPELFRGYTFNQFPAESTQEIYSPEQLKYLDQVRQYLGIK